MQSIEIFLDDTPVDFEPKAIQGQFLKPRSAPDILKDHVVVFHGEYYQGNTIFNLDIDGPFHPESLKLFFDNCGENGFVLSKLRYNRQDYFGRDDADVKEPLNLQFLEGR